MRIVLYCESCEKKTTQCCFDSRTAKFQCADCWDISDTEYMTKRGLDLRKPLKPPIDYTNNEYVIIVGNLLCRKTMVIETIKIWPRLPM